MLTALLCNERFERFAAGSNDALGCIDVSHYDGPSKLIGEYNMMFLQDYNGCAVVDPRAAIIWSC
jgi:hypothetical protein